MNQNLSKLATSGRNKWKEIRLMSWNARGKPSEGDNTGSQGHLSQGHHPTCGKHYWPMWESTLPLRKTKTDDFALDFSQVGDITRIDQNMQVY